MPWRLPSQCSVEERGAHGGVETQDVPTLRLLLVLSEGTQPSQMGMSTPRREPRYIAVKLDSNGMWGRPKEDGCLCRQAEFHGEIRCSQEALLCQGRCNHVFEQD